MRQQPEEDMSADQQLTAAQLDGLRAAISERYGISVSTLQRLGGELDLNFRAEADDETWFVRLTPISFERSAIEWQNVVLTTLAAHPLSVDAPRLIAQRGGELMSEIELDGATFVLRLTTWVRGVTVAELGATDRAFRHQLGGLAAEVVTQLSSLSGSANTNYEHHWMVVRAGRSIQETMAAVEDPHRYALIALAAERFAAVEDRTPGLPQAVVHQDLHDFNLLGERDASGQARVTGVVDFNDAVPTARIAELAIAAGYSGLRQRDAFAAFCDVVEGYLAQAELTDVELELLYPLAVARIAVNASTWTARAKVGNAEYALSRTVATWPALEQYLAIEPAQAAARFREIRAAV